MAGLIGNSGGDHFAYLGGFRANVTKADDAKKAAHPPKQASVAVRREAPAPSFGDKHKAGTENIEGNESPKYEAMEKKSLRSLKHGGTEKELREGHNTKKSMKLGGGGRFEAIEEKAERSGAKNPAAVAAAAGIKKYGKAKMAKMAAAGKKK